MMRSDRLSLRQRLLLWLLPPIMLLTGIWIWTTYAIIIYFAGMAYDHALEDTVETLAAQVSVEHGDFRIDLPAAANRMVKFDKVDHIYYSITDERGTLHVGNRMVPAPHLSDDIELRFERIGINLDQIEEFTLPTKPRKESDARSQHIAFTVEAEAMPAGIMRQILRQKVEALLPENALAVARVAEQSERAHLLEMAQFLHGGSA